jgi:hypothetical protein
MGSAELIPIEATQRSCKKLKSLKKRRKTNTRSEAALICEADYTIGVDDCAAAQLLKASEHRESNPKQSSYQASSLKIKR